MTIGLLILSIDNYYESLSGTLPIRPSWDKQFLLDICKNKKILCSKNTLSKLPKELLPLATTDMTKQYDINLGINTMSLLPDILLITRSIHQLIGGKLFNLSKYKLILTQGALEIWIKV